MTPDEQRIAIAETQGYMDIYRCGVSLKRTENGAANGKYYCGTLDQPSANYGREYKVLPNYLNDLNAMHEVEKTLTILQLARYRGHLATQFTDHPDDGIIYAVTATAAQRAEAYLRTLNLWKD